MNEENRIPGIEIEARNGAMGDSTEEYEAIAKVLTAFMKRNFEYSFSSLFW